MEAEKNIDQRKNNLQQSITPTQKGTKSTQQQNTDQVNQHEINPDTGFSAAVTAKINKEYESIADLDDVHINTWQRQLRVNKYMVEMEVRKMIANMLEPVYKQHEEIRLALLNIVGDKLVRIDDRVVSLEEIVYKGSTKKDRLTILEDKINQLDLNQNLFIQSIESQFNQLQQRMQDVEYREEITQKRCSIVEEAMQNSQKLIGVYEQDQKQLIQKQISTIEQYTSETSKQVQKNQEQLEIGLQKIEQVIGQTLTNGMQLETLQSSFKNFESSMMKLQNQADELNFTKVDSAVFDEFHHQTDNMMRKNELQLERSINDSKSCANYLEKYLPLYIQRQMSDFLEYVLPERQTKWRINWYNEIKIPMLTAGVMSDTGKQSLEERIDLLHALITKHIIPSLPEDPEIRTPEEDFVFLSLRNRVMHSKAKLIIMQLIGQIQNPAKKPSKSKLKIDLNQVTVSQLYGEMVRILKEENPELIDELILEGVPVNKTDEDDTKEVMEKDLEVDQSLEARIEREVRKRILVTQELIDQKLQEAQETNIKLLNVVKRQSEELLNDRCSTIQGYIQEVHKFQIDEMENFKQCHQMYLYSAQQFDRKIALIFDIEKNYQQMLRQVKALNNIITDIANVNQVFQQEQVKQVNLIETERQNKFADLTVEKNNLGIKQSSSNNKEEFYNQTKNNSTADVTSTTRISDSRINAHSSRAKSNEQVKRMNAQSVMTNYEALEPVVFSPGKDLQSLTHQRPRTQMQNRQQYVSNRINLQFATANADSKENTLKVDGKINIAQHQVVRKLSETTTLPEQQLLLASVSSTISKQNQASFFEQIAQKTQKNSKFLDKLIIKNESQDSKRQNNKLFKPQLPTIDHFRNQLVSFKQRLQDQTLVKQFENNILAEQNKKTSIHDYKVAKQNEINLGPHFKMSLGVRREVADSDGNKFVRLPDSNAAIFKEPRSKDGKIDNFNQAAGLEHQSNKHVNQLVFDKKAVIQSIKNFI